MNKHVGILFALLTTALPTWGGGWITVRTSVGNTQVMIDQSAGIKMIGRERSFYVEKGLHLLIIDKEGYKPHVDTVMVAEGSNRFMPVWLEPKSTTTPHRTSSFKLTSWLYQLDHGLFAWHWAGIGGGLATGLNVHVSLCPMRIGLFTIDPCLWGMNIPFFSNVSHVRMPWLVHPRDRRSASTEYEVAVPSSNVQFYYTPMVGVVLPFDGDVAFLLSAGPQISWTHTDWSYQTNNLPVTYSYQFTDEAFPQSGFRFDSVWFSAQIGLLFSNQRSDLLTYFKYQDGYFLGVEIRI